MRNLQRQREQSRDNVRRNNDRNDNQRSSAPLTTPYQGRGVPLHPNLDLATYDESEERLHEMNEIPGQPVRTNPDTL